ncbi:MAG: glycosyltransferase family 9 protein [Proteobacteria bacterium]|jgi:ADP-heptose:LPS heptosyltransferase|nr:glycosyltransferase family 9 protein [Pseudomonadota bacterium]
MKKIALIRLDKIGDLVSTLPCDEAFAWSGECTWQPTWVVYQSVSFLCEYSEPKRNYVSLSSAETGFRELRDYLKKEKPDAALIYYAPWWASFACWLEGIPLRVGRKSQWHSYLFLTHSLRQSRSHSEMHEAEYNWDLTRFAALKCGISLEPLKKSLGYLSLAPAPNRQLAERFGLLSQQYVVIHPGMAGSARNWSQGNYNALIEKLVNATTVVITGTPSDEPYLDQIKAQWQNHDKVIWLQNELKINELLTVLKNALAVVAPSTGVLHLAASVGTATVGLYSPIRAHASKRWGPRSARTQILEPEVQCPASSKCLGTTCKDYDCMDHIKVNQIIQKIPFESHRP